MHKLNLQLYAEAIPSVSGDLATRRAFRADHARASDIIFPALTSDSSPHLTHRNYTVVRCRLNFCYVREFFLAGGTDLVLSWMTDRLKIRVSGFTDSTVGSLTLPGFCFWVIKFSLLFSKRKQSIKTMPMHMCQSFCSLDSHPVRTSTPVKNEYSRLTT